MLKQSGPSTAPQIKLHANYLAVWVSVCNLQLHGCHFAHTGGRGGAGWAEALENCLATEGKWYAP